MLDLKAIGAPLDLDSIITAFEEAQHDATAVDIAFFLPERTSPIYLEALRELVRVDLEYGFARGDPRRLEDYQRQYPELFDDSESRQAICFEEYRLRLQAGQTISADDYEKCWGVDTRSWTSSEESPADDVSQVLGDGKPGGDSGPRRDDLAGMPEVGDTLLDFELIGRLGRGAFATVFLARQGGLADRLVALKVSRERVAEPQILARLQHTNIVPIYSVHQAGAFQVICMPYLGAVTFADVIESLHGDTNLPPSGRMLVNTVLARRLATKAKPGVISTGSSFDCTTGDAGEQQWLLAGDPPAEIPGACWQSLAGLSYAEAVLWIADRLAQGLAHAHQRGILHQDLKPANVLLADDGQPMLLDFNLAKDTQFQPGFDGDCVGGTLPYMAPEKLLAFQAGNCAGDARSDIYSLGVILYELLAGWPPYPSHRGPQSLVLLEMMQDRQSPVPRLRTRNPDVSPAVESIVRKCLAADPTRRYQSAEDLHDDLQRQLQHRPLRHAPNASLRERARKWARRHPRLTSASGMAALGAAIVAVMAVFLAVRGQRLATLESVGNLRRFADDLRAAQVACLAAPTSGKTQWADVDAACRKALARFGVLDNPAWQDSAAFCNLSSADRQRACEDVRELLFLMAAAAKQEADATEQFGARRASLQRAMDLNLRAESCCRAGEASIALQQQRHLLNKAIESPARGLGADKLLTKSAAVAEPTSTRDCCMLACELTAQRRYRAALPLWQKGAAQSPQNLWAWYGLGNTHERLGQLGHAAACYTACIALKPDYFGWYFSRGLIYLKQEDYAAAIADFDETLRRQADHSEARLDRAIAELASNRCREAIDDLLQAIRQGRCDARTYLLLAQAYEKAGEQQPAAEYRRKGMAVQPSDEAAWVAAAVAQAPNDAKAALAAVDRALACNAYYLPALESKAHLLAERLSRTDEAVRVLDRAITAYPENGSLPAMRGVLLARLGKDDAARRDAAAALALDGSAAATQYRTAGIYALLSRRNAADGPRAVALLTAALRRGFGEDLLATDNDLDPIRHAPAFLHLLEAIQWLHPVSTETDFPAARQTAAD